MPATSRRARSGRTRSAIGRIGSPSKSSSTQPRPGHVDDLTQVVVAVDALQRGPRAPRRRGRRPPRWRRSLAASWGTSAMAVVSLRRHVRRVASRSAGVVSCVGNSPASATCTSAVATPSACARSEKSSPDAAARSATRHASSTPGRNSWANASDPLVDCRGSPGSGHWPSIEPMARGTRGEPAAASAVCSSMSGLRPACTWRKTLQITGTCAVSSGR